MANLEIAVNGGGKLLRKEAAAAAAVAAAAEDLRRDEWSNDGVYVLLDIYEAKWNERNRGNLKGGDWEDVALRVSSRCGGAKTPFQCKNKVASMKQKYRSEALLKGITGSASSRWPFYMRLDTMLRIPSEEEVAAAAAPQMALPMPLPMPMQECSDSQRHSLHRNDDASYTLPPKNISSNGAQSDTNTLKSKIGTPTKKRKKKKSGKDVAASILSFTESILRLEEAKMAMFKDSERLRAELESRRVDMELKRTEIIMNTQLQIAKLLSGNPRKRKASSSSKPPRHKFSSAAEKAHHPLPNGARASVATPLMQPLSLVASQSCGMLGRL